jgi:hypothetical protein
LTASTSPRGIGKTMQNGSSRSKAIGERFRVNVQFIVKVKGDQSVSIIPVSG